MTLDEYLIDTGETEDQFAGKSDISQSTVNRIRNGHVPSSHVMRRIASVTAGRVLPNDYFDLSGASSGNVEQLSAQVSA